MLAVMTGGLEGINQGRLCQKIKRTERRKKGELAMATVQPNVRRVDGLDPPES